MPTKHIPGPTEKRELNFNRCSKHGVLYPKGNECPDCKAERECKATAARE